MARPKADAAGFPPAVNGAEKVRRPRVVGFGDLGQVPELYARWTLDPVIEMAVAVAHDFPRRPRHYRDVPAGVDGVVRVLSSLRARMGTDPDWPNASQRAISLEALVGPSDSRPGPDHSLSPFHQAANSVRESATAFSERVHDTGEAMLRQAFRDAVTALNSHLSTLLGSVLDETLRQVREVGDQAIRVLQAESVARAFGVSAALDAGWPLSDGRDGEGAVLVEEISRTLPGATSQLTAQRFSNLQRVAYYGALTLQGVQAQADLDDHEREEDELIGWAYSWETALRGLR
jgi:hypothetical protein